MFSVPNVRSSLGAAPSTNKMSISDNFDVNNVFHPANTDPAHAEQCSADITCTQEISTQHILMRRYNLSVLFLSNWDKTLN